MHSYLRLILPWLLLGLMLPVTGHAAMAEIADVPADPATAITLPAGFRAQVFARIRASSGDNDAGARFMAFGPDGSLYVSLEKANKVVMLPDRNHDGVADEMVMVADHLNAPQGLAFVDGQLLVANQDAVVRLERRGDRWPAVAVTPLISGLPSGGHLLKTLKLGPDGYLYLNVGSSCNVCEESDARRATILRYTIDGRPAGALATVGWHAPSAIWATGLRNSEGLAWQPGSSALFATNNSADMRAITQGGVMDDSIPPEHLNRIEAGKHYGWPHCWGKHVTDANFPGDPGFCATTQAPAITFESHSAPLGITFLSNAAFPSEYRDDAIVALHGSWNRAQPVGYRLVRVKFAAGNPVAVLDFASGWLNAVNRPASAWGRPVDVIVGPDGALYVSDDRAEMVYRISYVKKQ